MAEINVSLPTSLMKFVEDMVASGEFSSSSEVVREALRLLRDERAVAAERAAILQREVGIGLDQGRMGRFSDRSVAEIAEEVLGKALRR